MKENKLNLIKEFGIVPPKMHGQFRIGLPKVNGRFRIDLPRVHGRLYMDSPKWYIQFCMVPFKVSHSIFSHYFSTVGEFF